MPKSNASRNFNQPQLISNVQYAWRDDFTYGTVSPFTGNANWTVASGSGMTVDLDAHNLLVSTGTLANSITAVQSTDSFSVPFQVQFEWKKSSLISNNMVYLEIVNASGDMIAQYKVDGATSNSVYITNINANTASTSYNLIAPNSTIGNLNFTISVYPDEIRYVISDLSSTSTSSSSYNKMDAKLATKVPDPQQRYFVRIRVLNNLAPPTTSVTYSFDSITIRDIATIEADMTQMGYGNPQMSIPVMLTSTYGNNPIPVYFNSSAQPVRVQSENSNSTYVTSQVTTSTPQLTGAIGGSFYFPIVRATALSDQPGTLDILASIDAFITQFLASSVAVPSGGGYVATEVKNTNSSYTYKARFTNTGTATTGKFRMDIVVNTL